MTDFLSLCRGIASQLDGSVLETDSEARGYVVVALANEREGLTVHLRRGGGSESSRLRATMGQTAESRGEADVRETPNFYQLETAAAMSRGPDVIARQIESKIVQPAIEMLEGWKVKRAGLEAAAARLEESAARWRSRYPRARIELDKRNGSATFHLTGGGPDGDSYWYVNARIYEDGRLYIDRMSALPEAAAVALLSAMPKVPYKRGRSDYAAIRDLASDPLQTPAVVTLEELEEMRDCLPPIYVKGLPGFLVGEPITQDDRGVVYAHYYESRDGLPCARYHCVTGS